MKPLSLRDLEAVRLLGMRRNFRAAAAELGVSAPTLSHMIASIENRIGIRLFNRTTRSVAPTEAGETLIERMAPALASISEAFDVIEGLRSEAAGRIRLNASEVAAARLLPTVAAFMAGYPGIDVEIVSDGLLSDIVADGFDAGIRLEEVVPQDMVAIALSPEEQIIVVGSPAYFDDKPAPERPEDLVDHDCIVARLPSGRVMPWEFYDGARPFTIAVSGRLQVGSVAIALQAAKLGLGLAHVSMSEAREDISSGKLVHVLELLDAAISRTPPLLSPTASSLCCLRGLPGISADALHYNKLRLCFDRRGHRPEIAESVFFETMSIVVTHRAATTDHIVEQPGGDPLQDQVGQWRSQFPAASAATNTGKSTQNTRPVSHGVPAFSFFLGSPLKLPQRRSEDVEGLVTHVCCDPEQAEIAVGTEIRPLLEPGV
ncbi:LysR family transcriptional regulator [Sphingobium sp. HWE2-09]|uniref:LysR family transcriptional regulator n=1 Tax=Sphingobium sp. HWE2-09 TaxID=3108390 RepID=UPI002DD2DAE3|nr:LysR family transcriptional regulator [Sphingobium sp. HWE2-09]